MRDKDKGGAGRRTAWVSGAGNVAVPLFGAALAAVLIATLWSSAGPGILLALIAPVVTSLFGSVRVVVGESGVLIRMGYLGWPRRHVPFADIDKAERDDISALSMGGWGYRVRGRTTAYLVRSGESLALNLRNGRRVVITCRDAATGASLINDYLAARR
ncbi:hypothetical protein [Streptomyces radicis]|uniref:Bacterial Pleckstrin homology domain-containing protein n=1 Tax=Streptomyces radicis TaxID=1750517 RepID=A0A3A9VX32_9ACTN|nr:hypothetical protein [Streptomyces radicis]RKN05062.1 hypothetical protein D7319_26205 [Streptomyces radicis]RKN16388.1 hypothetical protein D7318_25570 [Streptomyces radicis]